MSWCSTKRKLCEHNALALVCKVTIIIVLLHIEVFVCDMMFKKLRLLAATAVVSHGDVINIVFLDFYCLHVEISVVGFGLIEYSFKSGVKYTFSKYFFTSCRFCRPKRRTETKHQLCQQ